MNFYKIYFLEFNCFELYNGKYFSHLINLKIQTQDFQFRDEIISCERLLFFILQHIG